MTRFITTYPLCSSFDPNDFLGVAPDSEQGHIITTLSRNIITRIQINTQKQIQSWSVLEKLTTKVVYDTQSQQYAGVFSEQFLRLWDKTTTDINKCKKLKFQKNIADLICADADIVVLYHDGSCELLADAIRSRKEKAHTTLEQLEQKLTHTLSEGKVTRLSDGRRILTYFDRQNDTNEVELVCIELQAEGASPMRFKIQRSGDVKVAGYAVISGNDAPLLVTIWSDKRMFLLNMNDSNSFPGKFVAIINGLKVDSPISIQSLPRQFVVIYGQNEDQAGASLLLYNTQFKLVTAKQFFKVYFSYSRLWCADDNILLAIGNNLFVVTYYMAKDVLAALVGTQATNDFSHSVITDEISEEETLVNGLQYQGTVTAPTTMADEVEIKMHDKSDSEELRIADGKRIPFESVSEFESQLKELQRLSLHVEVMEVEKGLQDMQITLMSNFNDVGNFTPEVELIARELENCGASEHEISEKLLNVVIKAELLQDVAKCLRRYTNISEKTLAKTLRYVLSIYVPQTNDEEPEPTVAKLNGTDTNSNLNGRLTSEEIEAKLNDTDVTEEFPLLNLSTPTHIRKPYSLQPVDVLNLVLACPFETEAIAIHIRRELDYGKVLLLLEHLYLLLTSPNMELESRPGGDPSCVHLEMQVFRWFGVLLATHFQNLALSRDVTLIELLAKWVELFELYKTEAVASEQLYALLFNVVQGKSIENKEQGVSKWYSVWEIDF